eukprot:1093108_1
MAGWYHTCVLSTLNKVKCFGCNEYGQLGKGDTNHTGDEPSEMGDNVLEIDFGSNFVPVQVALGEEHTCALSNTSNVKCFGHGMFGQLGYENDLNR